MNCPKCGAAMEEGKAYCANPGCGAVPSAPAERGRVVVVNKDVSFSFKLDFVLLARVAAAVIAAIAVLLLYFFKKQ